MIRSLKLWALNIQLKQAAENVDEVKLLENASWSSLYRRGFLVCLLCTQLLLYSIMLGPPCEGCSRSFNWVQCWCISY